MSKWDYMSKKEIIQNLIDICFECVLVATDDKNQLVKNGTDEVKAEWVARQLRNCGYNTKPMGMSWGRLVEDFE